VAHSLFWRCRARAKGLLSCLVVWALCWCWTDVSGAVLMLVVYIKRIHALLLFFLRAMICLKCSAVNSPILVVTVVAKSMQLDYLVVKQPTAFLCLFILNWLGLVKL